MTLSDPSERSSTSTRVYSAPAAACAAAILLLLAREPELSLAGIARALDRSKTLVFRVVRELEEYELIQRTPSGRFRLGIAALEIGGAYASRAEYVGTARETLQKLADITGETANLGVLRGPDVMCLINQEGHNVLGTFWSAGDRLPAHCTALGKALLAELPPERLREQLGPQLRHPTQNSMSTYKELEKELTLVRKRGHATARGEAIWGLNAIGMTVRLPGRNAELAAISISLSGDKFGERESEFLEVLKQGKERIERETSGLSTL